MAVELRDALEQIAQIRRQVARTGLFRGYRAWPVAASGLLALGAAGVQALWLPEPVHALAEYFCLWIGAAVLSIIVSGWHMVRQVKRSGSSLEWHKTYVALMQFAPALAVGGLLLFVFARHIPEALWLLPGLWAMLFGLGIFASCRQLPAVFLLTGVYYVLAGALCLMWGQGENAFHPLAVGLPFGLGQLMTAGLLYWTLERHDGEIQENA